MFIRVARGRIDTADDEAVLHAVREQIIPGARRLPGFTGFRLGLERETGRFVAVTAFETREQTAAMNGLRGAAEAAGFEYGPPDIYQPVAEVRARTGAGRSSIGKVVRWRTGRWRSIRSMVARRSASVA